ncbi:MAG: tRNA-dihydrouridine synthase family protein [Deltaproteobacteria bacterium]|nr:tRNA-dihydrouridine synthase family protein [Deltaproteobacteria bacterium]
MVKLPFAPASALAPMEGVTGPALRARFASGGGVGLVCTEFVRVSRAALPAKVLTRAVVKAPEALLSVQVMGNEIEKMAEAAALLAEAGADVVDLNVGCPMPRVVRKGVGAAMLKDPALLFRVVSAMRAQVPGLLSAKVRLGWDDDAGALERARLLVDAGVDFLVVHARRRSDLYAGVADWRVIRELARALPIPVIGNGDLWYAADALRLMRDSGAAGVMIGRPALRNPWIFTQLAALRAGEEPKRPSGEDVFEWLLALDAGFRARDPGKRFGHVGPLKEQLGFLLRAVDDAGALRRRLLQLPDADSILRAAEAELASMPASRLDLDAHGTLGLERVPQLAEA